MRHDSKDTIVAIATPPGKGGVGIVRVSGTKSQAIAQAILGEIPKPRLAAYARFSDKQGACLDQGLALLFQAPHSFTGEDIIEFHCHGSPIVLDCLVSCILELGARLARPGEFSERAFLNGKLDLIQAEAIADLIATHTQQGAQAAMRSLQGEFSKAIQMLAEKILNLRLFVEAAIDFPEEEIDFLSDGHIQKSLQAIIEQVDVILVLASQGCLLQEGLSVVILGKPNVGKSSILNRLSGIDSAIVTDIPGTTRDVLREYIHIDGLPIYIIDTAGLRITVDVVEQEGIRRAQQEALKASHLLLIVDVPIISEAMAHFEALKGQYPWIKSLPTTILINKIDLSHNISEQLCFNNQTVISLSAKTGTGFSLLREHLKQLAGYQSSGQAVFLARRRHIDALEKTKTFLDQGLKQLCVHQAIELLAEDLRQAHHALGEITGEFTTEDLLAKIFANFCIGK